MTDVLAWLGGRTPTPPDDLRCRLEAAVEAEPTSGQRAGERVDVLEDAGVLRLDAAVARPGRERASAFELLLADALISYACEAALEAEAPEEVLGRLVEVGRTR